MSRENVEIQREVYELFQGGGDWHAWFDQFVDEHVVLRMAEGWPERVYFGRDAARSFWDGVVETTGTEGSVIGDPIDAGDSVVTRVRAHLIGEHSGIEGEWEYTQINTFRAGKIVMTEFFWDHEEALEAVGLAE
jgi:ketosteroid isomerase-like protein